MPTTLISFKAPLIPGEPAGFVIPVALSRDLAQFGDKVPHVGTPVPIKGRRVDMLVKWGLVEIGNFGNSISFTAFGRIVMKYGKMNGKAQGVTHAEFLSHFRGRARSTSPRDRGIYQAIMAKNAYFFQDSPADMQFLYTARFMPLHVYDGFVNWAPDPDEIDWNLL